MTIKEHSSNNSMTCSFPERDHCMAKKSRREDSTNWGKLFLSSLAKILPAMVVVEMMLSKKRKIVVNRGGLSRSSSKNVTWEGDLKGRNCRWKLRFYIKDLRVT
jgi:hypothetical protein